MTCEQANRAWEAIIDALDEYLDAARSGQFFACVDSDVMGKAKVAFIEALTEIEASDD